MNRREFIIWYLEEYGLFLFVNYYILLGYGTYIILEFWPY